MTALDMQHVYDRLAKLEEFKENFERYEKPRIQQAYLALDSKLDMKEFCDFRDDYNSKSSFEFVDIKKN